MLWSSINDNEIYKYNLENRQGNKNEKNAFENATQK